MSAHRCPSSEGVSVGLLLQAVDVAGPHRWRWLLVDERSGAALADHPVDLDPRAAETEAFEDLYRFLRWRADPDRRVASEVELVGRVGAWIGSAALGEQVGRAIVAAAPVTVRVQVPANAEFLAFRPWELAHVGGVPLAARGDVALVYDLPSPTRVMKASVGDALRMLAVFSLPTATSALALRRERYGLSRLVRRVAARSRRRVELEVAQYGVTREVLGDLAQSRDGWDVLHLSGHGGAGQFLLEHVDGSADPVSTAELIGLLRPLRSRVKLAVVSACQSAAATTAETLRWLGLDDPAAELEAQAAQEAGQASPVGVARALVAELGCAVVAMRYPVIDDFAVGFADVLYDRVFRHSQPLDRAVAAAVPAVAGSAPPAISVGTPAIFGALATGLSLAPPAGKPILDPAEQVMARFPPEPPRFVGRAEAMATASAALAPESERSAVVFHGMAGAGKTACALELAYRHQRAFEALAFWSAPTDPDQFGDALRLLAMALEAQLGDYQFTMVDKIANTASLENFLPRLRTLLQNTGLLLVLDNLETLLTSDGHWRDPRWAPLISALTRHEGESRVILTSRTLSTGLDPNRVLIRSVHALSRDESLLLARELPNLRVLLHSEAEPVRGATADPALGRRVLTLVQGHPKLLELADAAAADRTRLTSQLAAAEAAVDGAALTTFLVKGNTTLDAAQFLQTLTAWTTNATATLPAPARLLLQALCWIEEADRDSGILDGNWANLWRRLDQPGDPQPLAEMVAPLVATALVATDPIDPADPKAPVRYRIHPGIAEAVRAATSEQVTAAVDAELAAWWTAVAQWGIKEEQAGRDTGQVVVRAGLAAAPYLLRQHAWEAAGYLIEQALLRDYSSPIIAQAVLPPLRRIAEATGELKDLGALASVLAMVDSAKAETLLHRVYDQATTVGDHRAASSAAGNLAILLREQGRLHDALALADQATEHIRDAGMGSWHQLGNQSLRLKILGLLGHHEQVVTELAALRDRMVQLPDQPTDNDSLNLWSVRESVFAVGCDSALVLCRWALALNLYDEIVAAKRRRGASPHEIAQTRFDTYMPLLHLGRLAEADQLLRECQEVFDTTGDISALGAVYSARANLECERGHLQDSVELERTAQRLHYTRPDPDFIFRSHHNLADYLSRTRADPCEQRAHRLAAALLRRLTGDIKDLTVLGALADELRGDADRPDVPTLPTALFDVIRLVDVGDGVYFGDLVAALCPDLDAADQVLADLLATAATLPDRIVRYLSEWEPLVTAVVDAASSGHIPVELADHLDELGATTSWATVVAALRRVLAGDRDLEQLLAGLDDIDTAILTAVLNRLPHRAGPMTSAATIDALTDH
jgi:tetratricopeptide (TPR) repeat protein